METLAAFEESLKSAESAAGLSVRWYNKAGQTRPDISLEKEWEGLVVEFLGWG